jgi:hypothetical protein
MSVPQVHSETVKESSRDSIHGVEYYLAVKRKETVTLL